VAPEHQLTSPLRDASKRQDAHTYDKARYFDPLVCNAYNESVVLKTLTLWGPSMATATELWIDGPTARDILGVPDIRAVNRLVDEGLIGVRRLGVRARFRREDVVNLAKLSVQPAHLAPSGDPPR
jgi:hypothetical protein